MEKARSLMPSLPHSSHIVNQALRGRKLDELSTNELSQILNDIELLVRELSEELVNDLVKYNSNSSEIFNIYFYLLTSFLSLFEKLILTLNIQKV
jgi:hypothetical protein